MIELARNAFSGTFCYRYREGLLDRDCLEHAISKLDGETGRLLSSNTNQVRILLRRPEVFGNFGGRVCQVEIERENEDSFLVSVHFAILRKTFVLVAILLLGLIVLDTLQHVSRSLSSPHVQGVWVSIGVGMAHASLVLIIGYAALWSFIPPHVRRIRSFILELGEPREQL